MAYEADYLRLVQDIIVFGQTRDTRNGATKSLFSTTLSIDELREDRFPLLTHRRLFYRGVFGELAAFVRGARTVGEFKEWGCNYWDANAKAWPRNRGIPLERMEVGQVYGAQWVDWDECGYNQLKALIWSLQNEPHSRRHVITTFSPTAVACLPPCHLLAQYYVNDDETLDCLVFMRSVDVILGLPSDVVLYSALLVLLAKEAGLKPGSLDFTLGDTHIYANHIDQFEEVMKDHTIFDPPEYTLLVSGVLNFKPENIEIRNYLYNKVIPYEFNV